METFHSDHFDGLGESIAVDLGRGKVVGWLQGRFENGPRALGNRSLLVDPSHVAATARLSQRVKRRAAFRPYACSLRAEKFQEVFHTRDGKTPIAARWMSAILPVREDVRSQLPFAVHIDGTTRPQVLARSENPRYHRLMEAWEQTSGRPALLNTSMNEAGFPMVSSPTDAVLMFLRTDMETLVLNNTILRKEF